MSHLFILWPPKEDEPLISPDKITSKSRAHLNHTLRSQERRKWSQTKEALDFAQ